MSCYLRNNKRTYFVQNILYVLPLLHCAEEHCIKFNKTVIYFNNQEQRESSFAINSLLRLCFHSELSGVVLHSGFKPFYVITAVKGWFQVKKIMSPDIMWTSKNNLWYVANSLWTPKECFKQTLYLKAIYHWCRCSCLIKLGILMISSALQMTNLKLFQNLHFCAISSIVKLPCREDLQYLLG